MQFTKLSMFLFIGASVAGAATLTVGPNGQYPTPCPAIHAAADGDTILIDANHGTPYQEPPDPNHGGRSDCRITNNYITIKGVNGRPVLDAAGEFIQKAIFVLDGHDITVNNLEFKNAATPPGQGDNGSAIKTEQGSNDQPNGGDITFINSYSHDNQDGYLSNNTGPGIGAWFHTNNFTVLRNDYFLRNGAGDGESHNMYIGYDEYLASKFYLQNSISQDANTGHLVKTRSPYSYITNNQLLDKAGTASYELDFCLGGTSYVENNIIYKAALTNPNANEDLMIFADVYDNTPSDPEYAVPHQDLHFDHNVVIDNNPSPSNAFVNVSCNNPDSTTCPPPNNGPALTTPAVIQYNLFIGQPTMVTNQPDAKDQYNLVLPFSVLAANGYNVN